MTCHCSKLREVAERIKLNCVPSGIVSGMLTYMITESHLDQIKAALSHPCAAPEEMSEEVKEALLCSDASVNWKLANLPRCADALRVVASEVRRLQSLSVAKGEVERARDAVVDLAKRGKCRNDSDGQMSAELARLTAAEAVEGK